MLHIFIPGEKYVDFFIIIWYNIRCSKYKEVFTYDEIQIYRALSLRT